MQLRALPGCSLAAAAALAERYGTYVHLHQAVVEVMREAAATTNAVTTTQENRRDKDKGSDKTKSKTQTAASVVKEGQTRLIADVMKLQGKGNSGGGVGMGGQRIGNKVAETIWRQVVTY